MTDLAFFKDICEPFGVDYKLVYAVAIVESNLDPFAARYEPHWEYWYRVDDFANMLGITRKTEKVFQATSWGLMQIMGTVARELGYNRHLTELTNPRYNVIIGTRKLKELFEKYGNMDQVISAYNQGSPRRGDDGRFLNHEYVKGVIDQYNSLK